MSKKTLFVALTGFLCGCFFGCDGRPMYPFVRDQATPGNHLRTKRGGRVVMDINSNSTAKVTGFRAERRPFGGSAEIDYLEITNDVTPYWAGSNQAMLNYVEQQKAFVPILNAHYDGLTKLIPAIIHEIAPIALPWIQAQGNVALQNAMRPTLIQQLSGGILSGRITTDLVNGVFKTIDPNIAQDVINNIGGIKPLSYAPTSEPGNNIKNESPIAQSELKPWEGYRATEDSYGLLPSEEPERPRITRAARLTPNEIGILERRS